jgi:hypothetical protein
MTPLEWYSPYAMALANLPVQLHRTDGYTPPRYPDVMKVMIQNPTAPALFYDIVMGVVRIRVFGLAPETGRAIAESSGHVGSVVAHACQAEESGRQAHHGTACASPPCCPFRSFVPCYTGSAIPLFGGWHILPRRRCKRLKWTEWTVSETRASTQGKHRSAGT